MSKENRREAAVSTAAGGEAGGVAPAMKEKIFSIIKKLENEGITDGRRGLWTWFSGVPNVLVMRNEEGYTVLLWREGVYVEVTLDENFEVTGLDVEVKP